MSETALTDPEARNSVIGMKQPSKSSRSNQPAQHTLRDEDVVTERTEKGAALTVRTDIRAGFHGSDFNAGKGR